MKSLNQVFDSLLWDAVPSRSTCSESEICGQVWPTWEVESLGESAWHSSPSPVSPSSSMQFQSQELRCGEEGRQPPEEMPGAAKEPEQHCALRTAQQTASALEVLGRAVQCNNYQRSGSVQGLK